VPSAALESAGRWDSRPGPVLVLSLWLSLQVPRGHVPGPLPSCWGPRGKRWALSGQEARNVEFGLSHGHRDHGGRWLNLQTLGPHSQLPGWMGPGHLLFNSPGSPGVAGGPTESSEKRWESPQLGLAPGGPRGAACGAVSRTPSSSSSAHTGGCLWGCVPHPLQLLLSTQTARQPSWNFLP